MKIKTTLLSSSRKMYLVSNNRILLFSLFFTFILFENNLYAQKYMEGLNRGLVSVRTSSSEVFVSWRLWGIESSNTSFNVYRGSTLLNSSPITSATNYVDNTSSNGTYSVRAVVNGVEQVASETATVWQQPYLTLNLQRPSGGTTPDNVSYTYSPNDCSVGDLDGDGDYEIIVKWDPSNAKDNSQSGYTGNVYLDAYTLEGTRLWRIDLGRNIRAGAHYTQFMVYDLDSDGKAEVACKTADATIDGQGTVIGNASADYRNSGGYVLSGPEYLTIFNGETGAAMATTNYVPARGSVSSWGDNYGNRVDRFLAGIAYVDGQQPSLIMCRGYYTRSVLVAWDWRNGQLTQRWTFDSNTSGNGGYAGQGAHSLTIGDVDGDSRDEIVYGAATIDDNGTGLYTTGLGHGDALHLSDMDPNRAGQEIFMVHECPSCYGAHGVEMHDAANGSIIWSTSGDGVDVGRGVAFDIDPRYSGYEAWGSRGGLMSAIGQTISSTRPSQINFCAWWDGDLIREILDGSNIDKWNYTSYNTTRLLTANNYGAVSNNGTKATPGLSADILGDWREEVIWRHSNNQQLLIFTTTIPSNNKIYTLMHDPQYRVAIAWQNSGYNQPPHPGFFLGDGMSAAPTPNIVLTGNTQPSASISLNASPGNGQVSLNWTITGSINNQEVYRDTDPDPNGRTRIATVSSSTTNYTDNSASNGTTYYYWIKTTDSNGNTINSNAVSATPTNGANNIIVRARGTVGGEELEIRGNGTVLGTYILGTSYQDYSVNGSGTITVHFTNDNGNYDVQVDYAQINGTTYQAEDQAINTGVWQDQCGGSYSEWINCNGYIEFDTGTPPSNSTITLQENETGFCGLEGTVDSNNTGFTGSGFANTSNSNGTGINYSVNAGTTGTYDFEVRFANGGGSNRPADFIVNGNTAVSNISFAATSNWTTWTTLTFSANLTAGNNTLRLQATGGSGLANIDYLEITGITPQAVSCGNARFAKASKANLENEKVEGLIIYPNPVTENVLQIQTYLNVDSEIHISAVNAVGQEVIRKDLGIQKAGKFNTKINFGQLPKGLYILKFNSSEGIKSNSFLIE